MGSDPVAEHAPDPDESPCHRVDCSAFRIGRTPVTNREYGAFVIATGHAPPAGWPDGAIPEGREDHPVTYVRFDDALAFCRWAGGFLPSEALWERAARGDDRRAWPWGDEAPAVAHATFGAPDTTPVGIHPAGASPFGALDLAGNVWEWTTSAYRPYPYDPTDGREDETSLDLRVVRGGPYSYGAGEVRCSYRHALLPGAVDHYVGFRVAAPPDGPATGVETVDVPAGRVWLGTDPRSSAGPALPDETPRHSVTTAPVLLAATPVTNAEYAEFVHATSHPPPPHWPGGAMPAALATHPVTYVDWFDAQAFCAWAEARLPTEAEWEKGARGTDARIHPWGDAAPDDTRANMGAGPKRGSTTPVDAYAAGSSPYGLLGMAGNVWEWVSSAYAPYPYRSDDGWESRSSDAARVLRGGSYASADARYVRCASRSRSAPGRRSAHIGFRAARDA